MPDYIRSERPILSISMMTPGEKPTLERCLQSLDHLRQTIPCEFVITDTGCDEKHRKLIEQYADKIIEFTWINDFSAARNAGLEVCSGEWLLIWDDDEVLFDPEELEEFFLSGEYKKWHQCGMSSKNFTDWDEQEFKLSSTLRPVEFTPQTRYYGKVHENLAGLQGENYKFRKTHLGHYGYIFDSEEARIEHCKRNIVPMQAELQENPANLHLVAQLLQELRMAQDWDALERISSGYYRLAKKHQEAVGLEKLGMFAAAWVDALHHDGRYEAAEKLLQDLIVDEQVSQIDRTALYAYGVWNSYLMQDWQATMRYAMDYRRFYYQSVEDWDNYVNRFFVDDMYTPKSAQITFFYALIAAFHARDEERADLFYGEIPWEDAQVRIHDDFVPAVCEEIWLDNPMPLFRKVIHYLLEKERFLEYTLQFFAEQLQKDDAFLLHLYPYIEDVRATHEYLARIQVLGAAAQIKRLVKQMMAAGQNREAEQFLQQVLQLVPGDVEAQELLAELEKK